MKSSSEWKFPLSRQKFRFGAVFMRVLSTLFSIGIPISPFARWIQTDLGVFVTFVAS